MPIRIPNDLPAAAALQQENIFVMQQDRAITQDIRPLEIVLLNLMPTKIVTETQLSRLLGNTPLQVDRLFIKCADALFRNENRIVIEGDRVSRCTNSAVNIRHGVYLRH